MVDTLHPLTPKEIVEIRLNVRILIRLGNDEKYIFDETLSKTDLLQVPSMFNKPIQRNERRKTTTVQDAGGGQLN